MRHEITVLGAGKPAEPHAERLGLGLTRRVIGVGHLQ